MINFSKVILVWYSALFVLAVVGPTSQSPSVYILGIVFVFLFWAAFYSGGRILGRSAGSCSILESRSFEVQAKASKLIISLLSLFAAFYISNFYTGNTPFDVVTMLVSGESVYNKYQVFTAEGQLTTFTSDQWPPFLCIIFTKFWFFYLFLDVVAKNGRLEGVVVVSLIGAAFSILYQGLSRGTSIEIFEFVFVLWFSLYLRGFLISKKSRARVNVFLSATAIAAVLAFNFNYSVRHDFEDVGCITNEICFDDGAFSNQVFPWFAGVLYKLNNYFTFGLFFFSTFLDSSLAQLHGLQFHDYVFPFRIFVDGPVRYKVCNKIIDCGPNWVPDAVFYFEFFGVLVAFFLCFVVGGLVFRLTRNYGQSTYFADIGVTSYICLLMVSLPVGNFVFSSHPSMGVGLIMAGLSLCRRFRVF